MKLKVFIGYPNNSKLIECDEMVTGFIYDENNKRIKFYTITLYKNNEIVLDTIKMTVENYEKLLKLLNIPMSQYDSLYLELNENDNFMEFEPDIINTKHFTMTVDELVKEVTK